MDRKIALVFRNQLREAREKAFQDAEAFDEIVHAVERLGSYLCDKEGSLGEYKARLVTLASKSELDEVSAEARNLWLPFTRLYDVVKDGRNDALHQGAFARSLTEHAIQLALILEDALLRTDDGINVVADYMVRNPVCAVLWQPVGFVRQQMLVNSFSYLPVQNSAGTWSLLSDLSVAKYLQQADSKKERKRRLANSLEKAIGAADETAQVELLTAKTCSDEKPVKEAVAEFDGKPMLVCRGESQKELVGILTAFDLL